ncbi:hypothetical protein QQ045_028641 [Rhodiola kirilowii]
MASLVLFLTELLCPEDAQSLYSSSQFAAAANCFGAMELGKGDATKEVANKDGQVQEAEDVVEWRVCVDLVWS